jgi:phosphoribosylaminoimidazolecarboxamide formyltransferase/IMP cyclohydrolase
MTQVRRALISLSDKSGIADFARGLAQLGVEILSTGGTAKLIAEAGVPVREVSDYTGFPEMMDGRVKTLHPKVHGALLALRDNPAHMQAVTDHGIELIDMVVVNLYPFQKTVAKPNVDLADAIENIDIGGPSMLRSAAKNFRSVAVICNPERYASVLEELQANDGAVSDATRASLALEAYRHTAAYDAAISSYLAGKFEADEPLPKQLIVSRQRMQMLRYGENPHQKAAFYAGASRTGLAAAQQLHGKELSFNNYLDLDAVLSLVREFDQPAACVVKHLCPCGAATADTLSAAYRAALEADPMSAFGGIIGFNREVDAATAQEIMDGIQRYGFMECILAPSFAPDALPLLTAKRDLRLLALPLAAADPYDFKHVTGGVLVQETDTLGAPSEWKVVTKRAPTAEEEAALRFAWLVCKQTKSNAIVIAQGTSAVGIGGGVTSRFDAAQLAVTKAGARAQGAVAASDAFFPKPDTIDVLIQAGVKALIQPGGSRGDEEGIAVCDEHGLAMVFTGVRHFKH